MKVLVTGSTGFVGSHLCERLTEQGHQVFALARNQKKFEEFAIQGQLIEGSLSSQSKLNWISELPQDLDAVIHTAGIVHSYNEDDFYEVNLRMSENLIKQLKARYEKLTFIHLSSQAAAGPNEANRPLTETHQANPVSHYGKSKLLSEKSVNELAPEQWDVKIIRPPMVIGPRDPAVLDIFKMVKSKNILVTGFKGKQKRYSFICVYDLVEAIIKALNAPVLRSQNVYFTAYGETVTMQELIQEIKEQMQIKKVRYLGVPETMIMVVSHALFFVNKFFPHSLRLTPDKYKELAAPNWECSGKRAEVEFDFEYSWNLKKTIEATLEDYHDRNWL